MNTQPTALIAEDEPLLAQTLVNELRALWPDIHIAATAGDGLSAVQLALQHRPDVLFFDIRMPGQSGLEAAAELAEEWPSGTPFPLLVFVTAYDQYAIQAFEAQAVDYVLKPVRAERLRQTVTRLQNALQQRAQHPPTPDLQQDPVLAQLRALLNLRTETNHPQHPEATLPPLQLLQASVGKALRMVPVADVLRLEAADKYVRVLTLDAELLLRTPLKELLPRLDPTEFWQVHRGTVVRASAIAQAVRGDNGKLSLSLHGRPESWPVSRLHEHRLRPL